MALSLNQIDRATTALRARSVRAIEVTMDSSYPTGGEPLTAADAGFDAIDVVLNGHLTNADGTLAIFVSYDNTNEKLLAYQFDGGAAGVQQFEEVGNGTDLSAFSGRVIVIGV